MLLERKVEAFDMIARRESGRAARDARVQAGEAFEQLVRVAPRGPRPQAHRGAPGR